MDAILSAVRGHLLAIQSMAADVHAVVAASTAGGLGLLFGATDSADSSSSSGSGASRSLLQSTSGETAGGHIHITFWPHCLYLFLITPLMLMDDFPP